MKKKPTKRKLSHDGKLRILRARLRAEVKAAGDHPDFESLHGTADALLLQFIGDRAVTKLHRKVAKWCA